MRTRAFFLLFPSFPFSFFPPHDHSMVLPARRTSASTDPRHPGIENHRDIPAGGESPASAQLEASRLDFSAL